MPIKIPDSLPAREVLESENIFVMTATRALQQDIRPLKLLILNLMPTKIVTETQLLRCLSNTPIQFEVTLLQTSTYTSKNTAPEHLLAHYSTFDQIQNERFDGMIITGAPVENLPFEKVDYWQELCRIFDWARSHVFSTFYICWGAQAALYYKYGIPKYPLSQKLLGVYRHTITDSHCPLTRGFDDEFLAPHSRHTGTKTEDVARIPQLQILSVSPEAGLYIAMKHDGREIYVTGHSEYDAETIALEYQRDLGRGLCPALPENYFPNDDPNAVPRKTWRSHGWLLYSNWLNYYVYQTTPYDLETLS